MPTLPSTYDHNVSYDKSDDKVIDISDSHSKNVKIINAHDAKLDGVVPDAESTLVALPDADDSYVGKSYGVIDYITAPFHYFVDRDYHIHLLGLMLALYFIGYQPIQALQTIRYPTIGNYNLAVLYGVFGLNSWFASFWIELLGPALVLPMCGCFMIVFPFTLFQNQAYGTILGAASHGFGTGLLWPSAGRIIASISTNRDEGTNSGLYQSYYRSAALVGGLVYAVMNMPSSSFGGATHWNAQYGIFATSEGLGIMMGLVLWFSYTRSQKRKTEHLNAATHNLINALIDSGRTEDAEVLRQSVKQKRPTLTILLKRLGQTMKTTWRVMSSREYIPMAMLKFTVCGISQAWFTANFNSALSALSLNTTGVSWLGWMQAIDQGFAIIGATATGLTLEWARKHYTPTRMKIPVWVGMILTWVSYGLSIYTVHAYKEVGVAKYGWNAYFGLLFANCFCYWVGFMSMEVSYYIFNITFFGPVSGSAFASRVFFEGMGNMVGFLANVALTTTYQRKVVWPIILFATTFVPFVTFTLFWKPPSEYRAFDSTKKLQAQVYEFDSEALDIAQREAEAKHKVLAVE